jgi:hypothetical protein
MNIYPPSARKHLIALVGEDQSVSDGLLSLCGLTIGAIHKNVTGRIVSYFWPN